ncbi:MAG: hypothetical protein LBJ77_02050 [Holosporales bacterium]|nr:hypothetical protein [Holosporales bacterium]
MPIIGDCPPLVIHFMDLVVVDAKTAVVNGETPPSLQTAMTKIVSYPPGHKLCEDLIHALEQQFSARGNPLGTFVLRFHDDAVQEHASRVDGLPPASGNTEGYNETYMTSVNTNPPQFGRAFANRLGTDTWHVAYLSPESDRTIFVELLHLYRAITSQNPQPPKSIWKDFSKLLGVKTGPLQEAFPTGSALFHVLGSPTGTQNCEAFFTYGQDGSIPIEGGGDVSSLVSPFIMEHNGVTHAMQYFQALGADHILEGTELGRPMLIKPGTSLHYGLDQLARNYKSMYPNPPHGIIAIRFTYPGQDESEP